MYQQFFHLPDQLIQQNETTKEPHVKQLKVEDALELVYKKCSFDLVEIELAKVEAIAQHILNRFNKAIIIGIGGALAASRPFTASQNYQHQNFSLIYSDSLASAKQEVIFTKDNLQNAAIIIISRSGTSIETISQTHAIIAKYRQYFGPDYPLGKHFYIITQGENHLKNIGKAIKGQFAEYISMGGKFSSFSLVGLLPARLVNLNPEEIVTGGLAVLQHPAAAIKAASINHLLLSNGLNMNVMMPYNDMLNQLTYWYAQIASEIVAKQGKGFTPIAARGIFDQHGLWQLFLAGPRDKYFTFLCCKQDYSENTINAAIHTTYHKLALRRLKRQFIPARELIIERIDAKSLGAITMHLLLEMVLLANSLNISPSTQPFIDDSKKLLNRIFRSYNHSF